MDVAGQLPGADALRVQELVLQDFAGMDRHLQHGHAGFLSVVVGYLNIFRTVVGPEETKAPLMFRRSLPQ